MAPKKKPTKKKAVLKRRRSRQSSGSTAGLDGTDRSGSHSVARELSWAELDRVVQQLSLQISKKFKPEAVVGVAHGGVFVGGALAGALKVKFYPVRLSRRSRDGSWAGAPKLSGVIPKELKGRRVVIADDIASSGDTLALAIRLVKAAGAKAIATTTLVCRPKGFKPDFFWENSAVFFVFPWDYDLASDQRFRALM